MFNKIAGLTLSAPFILGASAFAGEIGVSNSYGHSWRAGTGQTTIEWNTKSQVAENSVSVAGKIDRSSTTSVTGGGSISSGNGGWVDGDDKDKGKGNDKDGGSTAGGLGGSLSQSNSFAFAGSYSTRNYTEDTSVSGNTQEVYSFGQTNFTHSVSTFAR